MSYIDNPTISIVIPVFNGERYLSRTLDSLLVQTFHRFEIIVIDDCSMDNSHIVIDEFKKRDPRIIHLKTNSNLGIVPKVLSFALPYVHGDYFLYASQDDLFSVDWLEKMYERATTTGAEAVIPDMIFFHENTLIKDREWIGLNGRRDNILTNRDAVLLTLDWIIHGFVLWKTSIVKKCGFFEFGMYADEYSVRNFFFNCNKIVFSEGVFYYRQDNPEAITKKISYKRFDKPFNYYKIYQFLSENSFPLDVCERELEKSVVDLIGYAMELIVLRKTQSAQFVAEAEARVNQCFCVLNDNNILRIIGNRGGFKGKLRYFSLRGSYTSFKYWCRIFLFFKSLKKIKNILDFFNVRSGTL